MLNINIHNHTTFSDGSHKPEALVEHGHSEGIEVLGISDHFATSKVRCPHPPQLKEYISRLDEIKQQYRSKLDLLLGVEIDSSLKRTDFDSFNYSDINLLDFILIEYVEDPLWRGMKLNQFTQFVKKLTVPVGLAHPDIELCFHKFDARDVIAEFEKNNIFIELDTAWHNARSGKQYYHLAENFFELLKDTDVALAIGTDTHDNIDDVSNIKDAKDFIERKGLERNLELFLDLVGLSR